MTQISNNNVSHNNFPQHNEAQNLPEAFNKSNGNPLNQLWTKLKCTISNTKASLSLVKNKFIGVLTFPARLIKTLYLERAISLAGKKQALADAVLADQKQALADQKQALADAALADAALADAALADTALADALLETLQGQEQEIDVEEMGDETKFYNALTEQEQTVPEKDAELSKMHRALQTLRIKVANFISSRREPKEPKG